MATQKNPRKGPWAGCRLNRPIGFAAWPTKEEWKPIYDVEDVRAQERRRLIAALPEEDEQMDPEFVARVHRSLQALEEEEDDPFQWP